MDSGGQLCQLKYRLGAENEFGVIDLAMRTYVCFKCGRKIATENIQYLCPEDGSVLEIELDYVGIVRNGWEPEVITPGNMSMWRFGELIPVRRPPSANDILNSVGGTPLTYARQLNSNIGERVWIKNDSLLPTGSLKDRASAVVVSEAIARSIGAVITASTGNAGVALAGMAAAGGLKAIVVAPRDAPVAKIEQIVGYGAELVLVDGSYSDAYDLTVKASTEMGLYCRNTGYNPLTIEGKKTVSYEICEQLSSMVEGRKTGAYWKVPDVVIVPVGDGNMISGVYKGFVDLMSIGVASRIPKIVGVQAEGSAAIAHAYMSGNPVIDEFNSYTIADSISADRPSDGYRAMHAVKSSRGQYLTASDDEIVVAANELASKTGIFAELSAAVAYVGLKKLQDTEWVNASDDVIMLITGHGLKTVGTIKTPTERYTNIKPNMKALSDTLCGKDII